MKHGLVALLGAAAIMAAAPAMAQPAPQGSSMRSVDPSELPKVFSVRVTVSDLDRSERFYHEGLGAQRVHRVHARERAVQFASGVHVILVQGPARAEGEAPPQGAGGFIVQVTDIDAAVARVAPAGGEVVRQPNSGAAELSFGVRAAMVRDPDGVGIELVQFPAR